MQLWLLAVGELQDCLSVVAIDQVDVSEHRMHIQLVKKGFQCVQLVAHQYIQKLLHDCLELVVAVVCLFCRQTEDLNVSLSCICILWNLSDFVVGQFDKGEYDYRRLWIDVPKHLPFFVLDDRQPLRNFAIQSLFRTVSINARSLTTDLCEPCSLISVSASRSCAGW